VIMPVLKKTFSSLQMWIYALGETLKRVTLTSHGATLRLSSELYQVLIDMTKVQVSARASLMYLLEVSNDPVMLDLHRVWYH
jgi:hypothetical protein